MAVLRRREFIKAVSGVAPLMAGSQKRPNILLILADDQRFSTIHALGFREVYTPNLDRLVRRGTAFTNAAIMGGMTGAICVPSRASLLTGRTLFHLAGTGESIPPAHLTLPEQLRSAGYTTFITGKWHNDKASLARAFSGGADIFLGGMTDQWKVPVQDYDASGLFPKEHGRTMERFSAEVFTDAAAGFLRRHRDDHPFFLCLALTVPHDPRTAPDEFRKMYDPSRIALPPNFLPEHPFDNGELRVRDELLAPHPRTGDLIRRHIADYFAMITALDACVGRLLRTLEEMGRAEDTIVVFAGDNGLALGQHGLMGKQNLYDHSVRVPLIIAGPGIPRGRRVEGLCYLPDLYPTLCNLLRLPRPETVEGRDLTPLLRQQTTEVRDSLFFAYRGFQRAVRTRTFKLIEYEVGG